MKPSDVFLRICFFLFSQVSFCRLRINSFENRQFSVCLYRFMGEAKSKFYSLIRTIAHWEFIFVPRFCWKKRHFKLASINSDNDITNRAKGSGRFGVYFCPNWIECIGATLMSVNALKLLWKEMARKSKVIYRINFDIRRNRKIDTRCRCSTNSFINGPRIFWFYESAFFLQLIRSFFSLCEWLTRHLRGRFDGSLWSRIKTSYLMCKRIFGFTSTKQKPGRPIKWNWKKKIETNIKRNTHKKYQKRNISNIKLAEKPMMKQ